MVCMTQSSFPQRMPPRTAKSEPLPVMAVSLTLLAWYLMPNIRHSQPYMGFFTECEDYYELKLGFCSSAPSNIVSNFYEKYSSVSMSTCEQLCSGPRDRFCSGFFYDFDASVCHLVAYRGLNASPLHSDQCEHKPQLFVRQRCISEYTARKSTCYTILIVKVFEPNLRTCNSFPRDTECFL